MRGHAAKEHRAELKKAVEASGLKRLNDLIEQVNEIVLALNNQILPNLNALTKVTQEHEKTIRELKVRTETAHNPLPMDRPRIIRP